MIKILMMSLVIMISLSARENPFFPSKNETDIPITTNKVSATQVLERATLTLPSTARTIESVTVTYKNIDGSITSKKEELGYRIDWHLPIFISQNIGDNTVVPRKKRAPKEKFVKLASLSFISLYESKNRIKIITKDKMIRNFLLTQPHRIVCDFKRDIDIRSYVKIPKGQHRVKKIRVGNHKGYYRVVIELDGHYRYTKTDAKEGYYFNLL